VANGPYNPRNISTIAAPAAIVEMLQGE